MNNKTLFLTLSKAPFEVTATGEKKREFRVSSVWMRSRLYNKDGTRKEYDFVKFSNGYKKDSPFVLLNFNGFTEAPFDYKVKYSNGLIVNVKKGMFEIHSGDMMQKGNLQESVQVCASCANSQKLKKNKGFISCTKDNKLKREGASCSEFKKVLTVKNFF